jgi:hypothetical protein
MTIAIAIILLVLVLGSAGTAVYFAWRDAVPSWELFQSRYVTANRIVPKDFSLSELARFEFALDLAVDSLSAVWSHERIATLASTHHYLVVAFPTWKNLAGVTVGGELDGDVLKVGRDLSALCHELAHACQREFDHVIDEHHQSWPGRGITAADDAYRSALTF